jgi:hypothetical protein
MPMDGNARNGLLTGPRGTGRRTARWTVGPLAFLACLAGPTSPAPADRVSPLVIDEAASITDPRPWVSPTGEQLITYLRRDDGTLPAPGLVARIDGGPFSPFEALSASPALSAPVLGFGPDGTALLTWQAIDSGILAEQATRPPGGPRGPALPAGRCGGPVALSVSASGQTLTGCPVESGLLPGWSGRAGSGVLASGIAPDLEVTPATSDPAIPAFTAWGSNGTGVVTFGYSDEGSTPGRAIVARVFGPDSAWAETVTVAPAAEDQAIEPTGAAVLPNGAVAITADSDEGGVLFTRPPGPGTTFERSEVGLDTAAMPAADVWGRLHFQASRDEGVGTRSWWVVIRDRDGSLAEPIPVPTTGNGAEPVGDGLQVFPNGAETIVTRSDSGFYIAFRKPGGGAFSVPRRLAGAAGAGPGAAQRTPQGDILVVWQKDGAPGTQRLVLGGWDSDSGPAIKRLSVPKRVRRGTRARFSVVAADPMGIDRIVWRFPRNRRAAGSSVRVRMTKPGRNRVEVLVFDRAGGRSVRQRRVKVVVPRKGRNQGRPGTSGSPRP